MNAVNAMRLWVIHQIGKSRRPNRPTPGGFRCLGRGSGGSTRDEDESSLTGFEARWSSTVQNTGGPVKACPVAHM